MSTAFLGIGSNIDAERNIASAIHALAETFPGARFSPVYRSAPVGFTGDTFINLVAAIETGLDPLRLKTRLTALENAPPMLAFTTVALGGFRGLIANALWVRWIPFYVFMGIVTVLSRIHEPSVPSADW